MYELIHGTEPDIAGRGVANAIGSILSMAMMLRYSVGLIKEAAPVQRAVEQTLESGLRTVAIAHGAGSPVGTVEMGDHIVAAIAGSA